MASKSLWVIMTASEDDFGAKWEEVFYGGKLARVIKGVED